MVQRADKRATIDALLQKAGSKEKLKLVKVEEGKYSKTRPFLRLGLQLDDVCKNAIFINLRYVTFHSQLNAGYIRKLSCVFALRSPMDHDRIIGTISIPMVDCYFEVKEIKHVI